MKLDREEMLKEIEKSINGEKQEMTESCNKLFDDMEETKKRVRNRR